MTETSHHPKFTVIDISDIDSTLHEATAGYLLIKMRSLFPETILPCDVLCLAQKRGTGGLTLGKILGKGERLKSTLRQYLMDQEVDELYINNKDEESFSAYFNLHTQEAIESGDAPPEKKAELLYDQAEYLVKKVFREHPSSENIRVGQQLVTQFSKHVLADQITTQALLSLFSKDYYTFSHSVQVALLGMSLCKFLGWQTIEVEDFGLGALFHDIGKSSIDERILNKPGKLEKEEFELVKRHPLLGYERIKHTHAMTRDQLSIVLEHHEALDGSGYPHGKKQFEIHRYARVARIVDIYDALTSNRPYKEALPSHEALRLMDGEMKHTLDAGFFEALKKHLQSEKKEAAVSREIRFNLRPGTPIQLELEGEEMPFKGVLAGFSANHDMMVRIPLSGYMQEHLPPGRGVICRYFASNTLYAFHSTVLKHERHPLPLLFLASPLSVNRVDLRKRLRTDSYVKAKAVLDGEELVGVILDLSQDGCRLVAKSLSGHAPKGIAINTSITLLVDLTGKKAFEPLAGIVRNAMVDQDRVIFGVQFQELTPAIREAIDRLCRLSTDA